MPVSDENRFCLPARIRTRLVPEPIRPASFDLAERLAGLPFAEAIEGTYASAAAVSIFLHPTGSQDASHSTSALLCRISSAGISVEGLSDRERHQVLSKGWGRLENRRIRLYTPRDDEELDVCWTILGRAYDSILSAPASASTAPRASVAELPEYSYTCLC